MCSTRLLRSPLPLASRKLVPSRIRSGKPFGSLPSSQARTTFRSLSRRQTVPAPSPSSEAQRGRRSLLVRGRRLGCPSRRKGPRVSLTRFLAKRRTRPRRGRAPPPRHRRPERATRLCKSSASLAEGSSAVRMEKAHLRIRCRPCGCSGEKSSETRSRTRRLLAQPPPRPGSPRLRPPPAPTRSRHHRPFRPSLRKTCRPGVSATRMPCGGSFLLVSVCKAGRRNLIGLPPPDVRSCSLAHERL